MRNGMNEKWNEWMMNEAKHITDASSRSLILLTMHHIDIASLRCWFCLRRAWRAHEKNLLVKICTLWELNEWVLLTPYSCIMLHISSETVHFDGDLNVYYGLGDNKEWHHVSRNLLLDLQNGVSVFRQNKSSISIQKVWIYYCVIQTFNFPVFDNSCLPRN